MEIGTTLAAGLIGLSLAAFAPAYAMNSKAALPTDATISTSNPQQVAFDENTEEHQEERHEQVEHGRDRNEEFKHTDSHSEHIDTHNMVRDHTPGTEAHEQHEEHETEEQRHTTHQSDVGD